MRLYNSAFQMILVVLGINFLDVIAIIYSELYWVSPNTLIMHYLILFGLRSLINFYSLFLFPVFKQIPVLLFMVYIIRSRGSRDPVYRKINILGIIGVISFAVSTIVEFILYYSARDMGLHNTYYAYIKLVYLYPISLILMNTILLFLIVILPRNYHLSGFKIGFVLYFVLENVIFIIWQVIKPLGVDLTLLGYVYSFMI